MHGVPGWKLRELSTMTQCIKRSFECPGRGAIKRAVLTNILTVYVPETQMEEPSQLKWPEVKNDLI